MRMPTEKQIKKIEAEIEIEKANTVYEEDNFRLVKTESDYYIRNLTDYHIEIYIQEPYEHIFVRACSLTYFANDEIGEEAVIQEAMEEIKRLREQNGELYAFKRKLEDELIENGFAEYADEKFKTLTDYKTDIKDILTYVGNLYDDDDRRFQLKDYQWHKDLCEKYGVDVDNTF